MLSGLIHHRDLVWQLTKRDVVGRYRGSTVGLAWSLFHPILMLGVYTFVFSGVFNARWGTNAAESTADFAVVLFAGMIVHSLFAECVNRAPTLVVGNANFVKKVVFPLEVLPWVTMGSALFHAGAALLVLVAVQLWSSLALPATVVFFPLVLAPFLVLTLGVSWFLAATGVYFRDLAHATGVVTTVMLFLSPVFYSVASLPERYRPLLALNPLTFIIEQTREVLIWGRSPDWRGLLVYSAASLVVASAGLAWFRKARRGFADVL
jgi:lipopolysaccharide transport system permease protein